MKSKMGWADLSNQKPMIRVHLDTDLGGDIDDLCALAMLLRWPGVQITGITVVGDTGGRRTGYVRYVLGLEGRNEIPVAAGADTSQGYYRYPLSLPPEDRYWPEPVDPSPNPPGKALRLLKDSIDFGATLIGIGPYTNFALFERQFPGFLKQARLFLMGGYIYPPRPGFPAWGNEMDFNIQVDVPSAKNVLANTNPTLVPLSVTVETSLRRSSLDGLRQSGGLGQLIARQAEAYAQDEHSKARYGATCNGLPGDFINFQHDPLACAIALGWDDGVKIDTILLELEEEDGWLTERIHPSGRPFQVVTKVDGECFNEFWRKRLMNVD